MPGLRIAIFGNTNNSPLQLAEGLKLLGHEVRLIVNRQDLLHRPEAKYPHYKQDGYPPWILDFSHVTQDDIVCETGPVDDLIHELTNRVDLVILNDMGPALANHLRSPHVAFLTGSDLSHYASFQTIELLTRYWSSQFAQSIQGRRQVRRLTSLISRQREGIVSARVVCCIPRGVMPETDQMLDAMGVTDGQRMPMHLSNVHGLKARPQPKNHPLQILCGSRIVYRRQGNETLGPIDFKGTDVLLKGFSKFVSRGGQAELSLIWKGQDVEPAKQLIDQLNIGSHVRWLHEMPMHQFYEAMAHADLICDQFGTSVPGMVTTDAYALGRPVMCNFRNEAYGPLYSEPFPGFNVTTAEEIAEQLTHIGQDRGSLEKMGSVSRGYAERYLAPEQVAKRLLNRCGLKGGWKSLVSRLSS